MIEGNDDNDIRGTHDELDSRSPDARASDDRARGRVAPAAGDDADAFWRDALDHVN